MRMRVAVVMDPLEKIIVHHDTTFVLMLAAADRGYELTVFTVPGLFWKEGKAWGRGQKVRVYDNPKKHFEVVREGVFSLTDFEVILMRKDPPVDLAYLYATQLLDFAKMQGVRVLNNPQSLRDCNEKLFALQFPELVPETLVTSSLGEAARWMQVQGEVVVKPLDAMGGRGVAHCRTLEELHEVGAKLTAQETQPMLVQKFLPAVFAGDKRILLIAGVPADHALLRIPAVGEFRANLAVGGRGVREPITAQDREICAQVGPELQKRGILLAGIDVIGGKLTEINITSPTCMREIGDELAQTFWNAVT